MIGGTSALIEAYEPIESFVVVAMTTKHAPVVVLVTHDVDAAEKLVARTDNRRDVHLHRIRVAFVIHYRQETIMRLVARVVTVTHSNIPALFSVL